MKVLENFSCFDCKANSLVFRSCSVKFHAQNYCAVLLVSRRFMKWNATTIVTLFFSYPHELTKIVLQKFYKILLHQNALFGLANWTKKVFPVFPRNIPYRARPKTSPFDFFRHCETFFRKKKFSPKGPPCIFLMFCDRMDVKKSQRVPPFSFFRHCEIFSRKWKCLFSSIFSCFATEWMLKNLKGSTLSVFRHCETLARQGLALASPGAPLGPFFLSM